MLLSLRHYLILTTHEQKSKNISLGFYSFHTIDGWISDTDGDDYNRSVE